MKKLIVTKICLDSIFRLWQHTNLTELGITKKQIITVIEEEGKAWLIYWVEVNE